MQIHVVRAGETIYSIAREYGVGVERLIYDNGLLHPEQLVVGQTIVIQHPAQVHIARPGDTLITIAREYGVTVSELLRNNPVVSANEYLYAGQTIVIRFEGERLGPMSVNGYAYPFIDRQLLRQQLPYLTYLSLFTYGFTLDGELIDIDDEELIALAWEYGTAPLMVFSAMTAEGTFSTEHADRLFSDPVLQEKVMNALVETAVAKGYHGIDLDFEYIGEENRDNYTSFTARLRARLNPLGKQVFVTLAPKISTEQEGSLYEGHDYGGLGAAADRALLMTYEWGYTYGPPMAVAPLPNVRRVVEYSLTQIPAEKLLLGVPNYGYNWTLPYVQGESRAITIGNVQAVDLARRRGAEIQFDEVAQAPYFNYYDDEGREHVVWFEDARSVRSRVLLVDEYGLDGVGIWQVMRFFPQQYLVMNALYDIRKIT